MNEVLEVYVTERELSDVSEVCAWKLSGNLRVYGPYNNVVFAGQRAEDRDIKLTSLQRLDEREEMQEWRAGEGMAKLKMHLPAWKRARRRVVEGL